jgi:small subunit ribosomal protein S6
MRRYETIVILDSDLSEDQRSSVSGRAREVITQQDGFLAFIDDWGARKLAYEIKKKERGYYVRFDYCGTGAVVNEMERIFRIDDGVLKYMTVLTDEAPDLEDIKEEIVKAEAEQTKAEQAKAEAEAQAEAQQTEAEQAKAEAEAQAEAQQTKTEVEEPVEAEAQTEAEAPVEPEAQTEAQAQTDEKEQPAAAQSDVPEKPAPLETQSVEDETVPTDSEEEKK